jgi:hypothetical protein
MNAEIGTEAVNFPEKEYINGILLQCGQSLSKRYCHWALLREQSLSL